MNYRWSIVALRLGLLDLLKYLFIIYISYLTAKEEQFNWQFVHIDLENAMIRKINLLISNRSVSYIYYSSQLLHTAIFENVSTWIITHFY